MRWNQTRTAPRPSTGIHRKPYPLVRRGKHGTIRVCRALIITASAAGTPVPAIARLVAAHEDIVRDVTHRFNESGRARWTLTGREAGVQGWAQTCRVGR